MEVIVAPTPRYSSPNDPSEMRLFLAGSIEMGKAEDWQSKVIKALDSYKGVIYNPRRSGVWDGVQTVDNEKFAEQVNWELDHINAATCVLFHFCGNTMSPITLLELGLVVGQHSISDAKGVPGPQNYIVSCEKGYWRRGNLEVLCDRKGIRLHETIESALRELLHGTK